jgi:hypothetical protein
MKDHNSMRNFLNSERGVQSLQLALSLQTASTVADVLNILDAELGSVPIETKGLILQLLLSIDELEDEIEELRECFRTDSTPPRISDDYL